MKHQLRNRIVTPQTQASGQVGTVYVPNRDCNGVQSVIVSQDNGTTWTVHPVQNGSSIAAPGTVGSGDDPAVGIDNNGRVYFSLSNFATAAAVATSDDVNPDRLAHAANSLREILEKIPRALETEVLGPDRNILENARNAMTLSEVGGP